MTHPREFVHDEHVILGVSLACAMTRRETYGRVGGLDEVALTGAYLDLDFCAKAITAGMRNYYFGTLTAAEHGPDLAYAPANREYEVTVLHERHARVLASWRLRMLVHTAEPIWPVKAHGPIETKVILVPFHDGLKPVRYQVVDKVNSGLKRALGPFHGLLKRGLSGSWHVAKSVRGGVAKPAALAQSIYRPKFARRRSRAPKP